MSAWPDLVTASLIGTERAAVPAIAVPGVPAPPAAPPGIPSPEDPAGLLLDRAALLTVARRGGRLPWRAEPLPAAEPDPAPAVSRAAARRLARILGGDHRDLLAEWLAAAAARGRRVPAHLLPGLLDRVRRTSPADPDLCRLAGEAGGSRARWLAGLNPEWTPLLAEADAGDDAWRLGTPAQRRGYLSALRARDPGAARDLIAASWAAAGPDERVMFVNVLAADGLSLADEPMLEIALDHGNAWTRKMAADVLAALPGSALARRMAERAARCLELDRVARGTRLLVTPPAGCDAVMRRDGVTPGPGGPELAERARLLLEVVARAPLRTWTDGFGLGPAEIVRVHSGDWAPVLAEAWSRAALAQCRHDRDAWAWMAALISRSLEDGRPAMSAGTGVLSQLARRASPALGAPGALPRPPHDAPPALAEAVQVLRFRYEMLKELEG